MNNEKTTKMENSLVTLYAKLESEEFQNAEGNIFYNYYIYQYPPEKEYYIREQILDFQARLARPSACINAMTLDLFKIFCEFLGSQTLGKETYLDSVFEVEKQDSEMGTNVLTELGNSDDFIQFVADHIKKHIDNDDEKKSPYIFVYGIGKIFPYLRTNVFLTRFEKYNNSTKYKIILFYPGHQDGCSFSLFDRLSDSHTYRATLLVN